MIPFFLTKFLLRHSAKYKSSFYNFPATIQNQQLKVLQYPSHCHHKNKQAMERMCAAWGIGYENTDDFNRLKKLDYSILWLPNDWIEPDAFPDTIKIIYGPQLFVLPKGGIVGKAVKQWSTKTVCTCLSNWVHSCYMEMVSSFKVPLLPLPFSVDINSFAPVKKDKKIDFIIYFKQREPTELAYVVEVLKRKNLSYKIIMYGEYKEIDYVDTLEQSRYAIWIGRHESQGYAFQECLSFDIPILVWDVKSMFEEIGKNGQSVFKKLIGRYKLLASAASYWDNNCGEIIYEKNELETAIHLIQTRQYQPRKFIEENFTDKICMSRFLKALNISIAEK